MGIGSSTTTLTQQNGQIVCSDIVGQVRPIEFGHQWSIGNFRSCCNRLKTGDAVVSPMFRSGAESRFRWRLVLYPNGDCKTNEDYVSVYLQLVDTNDDPEPVKSAFSLAIINSKMEVVNKHERNKKEYCFIRDRTLWGYGRFVNRAQLFEVPKDGRCLLHPPRKYARLTILCFKNEGIPSCQIPAELNLQQISVSDSMHRAATDMEELLRSGRMSDVSIAGCNGDPIRAHRAILSARSPFFAAMFEHDMCEREQECIHLPDLRHPILLAILHYLYGGRVVNLEETVFELIVAADKYALDDLKVVCEDYLTMGISAENVVELLVLADMVNAKRLKNRTHSFIIENSKIIVETKSFKEAMDSHPKLIAEVFRNMVKQE